MNDKNNQETAKAQRSKKFYKHLSTFIVVNIILLVLNMITDPHHWWFYWITLFWGIVIAIKALSTFGIGSNNKE